MPSNKPITERRYRELVLSHLAICARKSGLPINALPPSELKKYGVMVEEGEKGCKQLKVDIPKHLGPEKLDRLVRSLEDEKKRNGQLFPNNGKSHPGSRGRRPGRGKDFGVPILDEGVDELPDV